VLPILSVILARQFLHGERKRLPQFFQSRQTDHLSPEESRRSALSLPAALGEGDAHGFERFGARSRVALGGPGAGVAEEVA